MLLNGLIVTISLIHEGGPTAAQPAEILLMIIAAGFVIAGAVMGATFVIAFYLVLFGLPVAWLLGARIAHPLALGLALVDALISAGLAVGGSDILSSGEDGTFPWVAYLMVSAFALPAGYLYRRQIIAARETAELFA